MESIVNLGLHQLKLGSTSHSANSRGTVYIDHSYTKNDTFLQQLQLKPEGGVAQLYANTDAHKKPVSNNLLEVMYLPY